jgi:hypothetical protein
MTGRNFLLPSPRAWAFLSVHAVLVLLPSAGPTLRRGLASFHRTQGYPWPAATSTRTGSRRPKGRLDRRTSSSAHWRTSGKTRPPCAPYPPPSRGAGVPTTAASPYEGMAAAGNARTASCRASVMVKIGSKAPANVRTFFPRPPQSVSPGTQEHRACAQSSRWVLALLPRSEANNLSAGRSISPPTNP